MPRTLRADGRTSAYGFACGYQDITEVGDVRVRTYQEHGTFHVRSHDHGTHERIAWHVTRSLGEARRLHDSEVRAARTTERRPA